MDDSTPLRELDARVQFRSRPIAVPSTSRALWKVSLVVLIVDRCHGKRARLATLHAVSSALSSASARHALLRYWHGEGPAAEVPFRVEPALNRAIDLAVGQGLLARQPGTRVVLTEMGRTFVRQLTAVGALEAERQTLSALGERLTEAGVRDLMKATR